MSIEMQQQHLSNLSGAKMSCSFFCALSGHTDYGLRADAGQRLDFIFSPLNAHPPTPRSKAAKVSSQVRQILGLQMDQEVVRPTFGRFHRSPRFCPTPQGCVAKTRSWRLDPSMLGLSKIITEPDAMKAMFRYCGINIRRFTHSLII